MSRNKNDRNRYSALHATSFSTVHPPGGLVAWPDGHTSRIGEFRHPAIVVANTGDLKKGFVAWPIRNAQALRA